MYTLSPGIIRDLDKRRVATSIAWGDCALPDVCNKRAIINLILKKSHLNKIKEVNNFSHRHFLFVL